MSAQVARINHTKHKEIMVRILYDMYSSKILKDKLVFKWGTALYLFYGLDRFSTDLDFDLLLPADEEAILKEVKKIASKYGEVKNVYNKRYTLFLLLSYSQIDHNIKIEINKRWITGKYDVKSLIGINILTMTLESMTANKLVALTNRTTLANRDLYDIDFIFRNNFSVDEAVIKAKTWLSLKEYYTQCADFIRTLEKGHNILDWLWVTLDMKRKSYVKNQLFEYLKKEFIIRGL